MAEAKGAFAATSEKQRVFGWVDYAAGTWERERRVIAKAEYTDKGENPRYVVTSLEGDAQALYDKMYCAHGLAGACLGADEQLLPPDARDAGGKSHRRHAVVLGGRDDSS